MLSARVCGAGEPVLFFLHFLGGDGGEWAGVTGLLEGQFRCVTVDLPGFGGSAAVTRYSVEGMADAVGEVIRTEAGGRWMLVGHSMGAKVAAVLARRAEDGEEALPGLMGLVLLAGSPPGPEPMEESVRRSMLGWFDGGVETSRREATRYIEKNSGGALEGEIKERAVEAVLGMNRAAWVAWLESGSREDWSKRVGVLRTPTLVVAGEKDKELGPDGQRSLMLPHFASARMEVLAGAVHLLPMERPREVAELIASQVEAGVPASATGAAIDAEYMALIESDRVSARTRAVLLERGRADDDAYEPVAMSIEELAGLRAVVDRVLPQRNTGRIDIAARIDRLLAEATGDGWRYAELPTDAEAFRAGLRTLDDEARAAHGKSFGVLTGEQKDALLERAAMGALGRGVLRRVAEAAGLGDTKNGLLDGERMRLWFEDVRAEVVKVYVGHPATLARMGYGGIGDGADAETMQGFVQIGAGEREAWEPVARASVEDEVAR